MMPGMDSTDPHPDEAPPLQAEASAAEASQAPVRQARNPLHGITLETIVTELVEWYGWANLYRQVPLNCFRSDPSVKSTLTFLRKTPWAREKIESLYLFMNREKARAAAGRK
jgi:uncharacterized protein (DUF2132 family)